MPIKTLINLFALGTLCFFLVASALSLNLYSITFSLVIHFAEPIALFILLLAALFRSKVHREKLEPLFWYLVVAALVSWFLFDLFQYLVLVEPGSSSQGFISDISYFIFCALMIAAIEVKSFSEAQKFINRRNLITLFSLFTFLVGSFSYFILAPTDSAKLEHANNNSFYFYAVMDGYLALRWWYIAHQELKGQRISYVCFALASFVWLIVDLLRINSITQIDANWHWLNQLPFLLLFIAIQTNQYRSNKNNSRRFFRRYQILNSPIFFLGLIALLLMTQDSLFGVEKTSAVKNVEFIWVLVTITLAVIQTFELFETIKLRKIKLQKVAKKNDSMKRELENQSKQLDYQITTNQAILDSISNPIFTLDLNGKIMTCNLATRQLLGYRETDLVGQSFTDLVPESEEFHHFFDYQSYRQQLARNKKGLELESKLTAKTGEDIMVHITLSQGLQSTRDKIIVSLADIREQKKAEQQLHDLRDEFTANISHEFRTPLTIVNGVIDELINEHTDSKQLQSLEIAKRNNLRLIHMVDQLLELSRLTSDTIVVADINASDWVEPLCQSYQSIAKDKNIDFQHAICSSIVIRGNQQAFEKILYNLVSNAFKYTPQGGSVNVALEEFDTHYLLTVADTGIGISKEDQTNIFNRFQRAETISEQAIPGVGIGLALVKDLVNAMKWQLSLTSSINKGSQFTIKITKAKNLVAVSELEPTDATVNAQISLLAEETKIQGVTLPIRKSKFMILMIEDNIDMQRHLENIISPHHQCLVASNGTLGLSMAEEFLPDLILCDVMMPGIDGFEVLEKLKSESITAHIPVIMLTAKTDRQSKLKGLKNEAEDYISKPFDAEELLLKLTNQINVRRKLQQKYEAQWQGFTQTESSQTAETPENEFLVALNLEFEKFYTDPGFSMSHLANHLSMSDRQLQRKIKALVDVSPLELLKRFRLEKAKLQLKQNVQIGLVAQSCGFSSQTYFGRCFKEHFGVTPKIYQQS
jgi:PAS domain S-box-containing protein